MKFKYKNKIITASSKVEAINKVKLSELSLLSKKDNKEIFRRAMIGDKSILKLPKEYLLIEDTFGFNPVHYLAQKRVKEILKLPKELLVIKNKLGQTAIHYLAHEGVEEILTTLPKELLYIKNDWDQTPLDILSIKKGTKNKIR